MNLGTPCDLSIVYMEMSATSGFYPIPFLKQDELNTDLA